MTGRLPHDDHRPDSATMLMIRESRTAIAARPVDLAAAVYRHLPSFAPRTKELLAADIRLHGDRLVKELLRAAEVLDELATLEEDLRRLGAEHAAHHGVARELAEHLPYLGQALVRAVRELFPNSEGGPLGSAWLEVFEWFADEMMRGAVSTGSAPVMPETSPAYWRSYVEESRPPVPPPPAAQSPLPPPPAEPTPPSAPAPVEVAPPWASAPAPKEAAVTVRPAEAAAPRVAAEVKQLWASAPAKASGPPASAESAPPSAEAGAGEEAPLRRSGDAGKPGGGGVDPAQDLTVLFDRGELFERLARIEELGVSPPAVQPVSPAPPLLPRREPLRPVSPAAPVARPQLPQTRSELPGARPDLPGLQPQLPTERPELPAPRPELPAPRPEPPVPRSGLAAPRPEPPVPQPELPAPRAGEEARRPRRARNPWSWASRSRHVEPEPQPEPWPPPPQIDPSMFDSPPEVAPPPPRQPPGVESTAVGESAVNPTAETDPAPGGALRGVGTGWPRATASRPVRPPNDGEPNPVDLGDAPAQE